MPRVDTLGERDAVPWRRARLFSLLLFSAPPALRLGELDAAAADGTFASIVEPLRAAHRVPPREAVPAPGERYLAEPDALLARGGEPAFAIWHPAPWSAGPESLLDVRVLELSLLRVYDSPFVVLVEVRAAHRLSEIGERLAGLPEEDPAAAARASLLVRDGRTGRPLPFERADDERMTVLRQHGPSMVAWVALERDADGFRVRLAWTQIGYLSRGALGDRRLEADAIEGLS